MGHTHTHFLSLRYNHQTSQRTGNFQLGIEPPILLVCMAISYGIMKVYLIKAPRMYKKKDPLCCRFRWKTFVWKRIYIYINACIVAGTFCKQTPCCYCKLSKL